MRQRSKVLLVFLIVIASVLVLSQSSVRAETKDLSIVQNREATNLAYRINIGGQETDIWKIIEVKNNQTNFDKFRNNIYCIRGGVGFGNGVNNAITTKTYTYVSDMKNVDSSKDTSLLKELNVNVKNVKMCTGIDTSDSSKIKPVYTTVPYNNYNAILWLFDNMYLPKLTKLTDEGTSSSVIDAMKKEMKTNLLKAAFSKYEGYVDFSEGAKPIEEQLELTDDDIEVIQQLALWHFTNNKVINTNTNISKYDVVSYTDDGTDKDMKYNLRIFNSGNSKDYLLNIGTIQTSLTPSNSTSFTGFELSSSSDKQIEAEILFTYLVHSAMQNANSYIATIVDPISLENTTLTLQTQNENKLIGPFRLKLNNSNIDYTLTAPVIKDQDENEITNYSIAYTEDGQTTTVIESSKITSDVMKSLIGKDFYVVLPANSKTTGITLSLEQKYFDTTATFWKVDGANLDAEQPIAIIDKKQISKEIKKGIDSNFDLALRKFITAVNGNELKTGDKYTREPKFNIIDGKYIYTHPKDEAPVSVESGDIVTYTLRIYNEGTVNGYAQVIRDDIPDYLKFLPDNSINKEYGWHEATVNGKTVIETNYLQYDKDDSKHTTLLKAFDKKNMSEPKYLDIKVAFEVTAPNSYKKLVVNTAEIADDADENGNPIDDVDSIPGNGNEEGKDKYNNFKEDDIDKEYVKLKEFDLALRKFITGVNDTTIDSRIPQVNIDANGKITYTHPKTPVTVHNGDKVIYTIRIFNEGETSGYADEITDYIPEGTEFIVDDPLNIQYRWKLASDSKTITTDYLSKVRDDNNLLKAFGGTKETLDYKDVKIALKVTEPNSTTKDYLENIAEITEDKDKNGNPVDDIDSTPKNKDEETRDSDGGFNEDDTDFERIKLEIFDLALRKFIIAVNGNEIKNGDKYDREPNPVMTDAGKFSYRHKKDESPVSVQNGDVVTYIIRVYNEGTINGYCQVVYDDVPEGLEFLPNNDINVQYGWKLSNDGKSLTTDYLSREKDVGNIINAFDGTKMSTPDYKDVKIAFKVTEPNNSTRMVVNTAEIAEDADENGKPVDDIDSIPGNKDEEGKDQYHNFKEDDIDKDYLVLKQFDLALRKFIIAVNGNEIKNGDKYDREPNPVMTDAGKFSYRHKKDESPVSVQNGDVVTYIIRVYNEGTINGYCQVVYDDVPEGLEFLPNNDINVQYGWKLSNDGKSLTTDYLSREKDVGNIINAFDGTKMSTPDYKDVKIAFKVTEPNNSTRMVVNTAEIAEDADENGKPVDDIDSIPGNKDEEGKDQYHNFKEDDIDKDYLVLKQFDLALRKFITAVNGNEITTRIPQPTYNQEKGRFIYIHPKDPILVADGNVVTYTIRVYNEGTIDGYAQVIYDDVPQNLEFIPDNDINMQYGWKLSEDGKSLTTDYLSKEKADGNLIVAFDKNTMQTPAYKDVKIAFKVNGKNLPSDKILINTAEIAEDADKNGNPVDDIDSTPGNKNEEGKDENHNFKEDDIDKEYVKVQYFDLSLLKWVSKVITTVDGQTTERDTGHTGLENPEPVVKEEINRKKLNSTTVKFGYTIKITNEGEIAGYAKEISDYIPEGLRFVAEDNPGWTEVDGKVTTDLLANTLLQPGESAEVYILLTWINNSENMGVKINTAEISKDYNEYGVPDIDSTPNNKVPGEDDIDDAPVALSISTGGKTVIYFGLIGLTLALVIGGVVLIRKYVI